VQFAAAGHSALALLCSHHWKQFKQNHEKKMWSYKNTDC